VQENKNKAKREKYQAVLQTFNLRYENLSGLILRKCVNALIRTFKFEPSILV